MPAMTSRNLIFKSDLVYHDHPSRSEEGMPIGNGRMGTLVWTNEASLHMQLNRSDVFAVNRGHRGRQMGPTDYCGGCAQITVDFGKDSLPVDAAFTQRVSLYDAEYTLTAAQITVRCFISSVTDLLVMEIDDQRSGRQPVRVTLSHWRPAEVISGNHIARARIYRHADTVSVVQQFSEDTYFCSSAVCLTIPEGATVVTQADENHIDVMLPPGATLLFLSSASSWDRNEDVEAGSRAILADAAGHTYETLRTRHITWWHEFWSRTFVHLTSDDGTAELMERLRHLHLYYMASCSRGTLPPKFNGMLFNTDGDTRKWGAQFWLWNTDLLYFPLFAADAWDLAEPYFSLYVNAMPACEVAARQRWGVPGLFYPETMPFDGPTALSKQAAQAYEDVFRGRKTNTELPPKAREEGQYCSQLSVVSKEEELAAGRYTWISHLVSSAAEVALHAWWRYRYLGDEDWLRTAVYPLLRGAVEFYRHLAVREADGRYHLAGINAHESFWGVRDSIMDLAAIRGIVPILMTVTERLDIDEEMRPLWQEFLDYLAQYPMGSDPGAKALNGAVLADDAWAAACMGAVENKHNYEDLWMTPVFPFEDVTLATPDQHALQTAQRTLDLSPHRQSYLRGRGSCVHDRIPIIMARMGRGDELAACLAHHYTGGRPLANAMSLAEGDQALSAEYLGAISTALQDALVQSVAPRSGEPEIIHLLPAWPRNWHAEFCLLVRGGFMVSGRVRNSRLEELEIVSRRGEDCRLRNPWHSTCRINSEGQSPNDQAGDILTFPTKANLKYRIYPLENE